MRGKDNNKIDIRLKLWFEILDKNTPKDWMELENEN